MGEIEVADWGVFVESLKNSLKNRNSNFLRKSYENLLERLETNKGIMAKGGGKVSHRQESLMRGRNNENRANNSDEFIISSPMYKKIFQGWLRQFINKHLSLDLNSLEKKTFILDSHDISERISPDIQGRMTKSLIDSGEIIADHFVIGTRAVQKEIDMKESDLEMLYKRDTTRLMQGYKLYGKDIDVNDWFQTFIDELYKSEDIVKGDKDQLKSIKERFLKALGDLKFMGYISESGRGTYIFKRNYFGKNQLII